MRGGAWIIPARNLRSANRKRNPRGNRNQNLGFRVALSSRGALAWMRRMRCPWTRWRIRSGPADWPAR